MRLFISLLVIFFVVGCDDGAYIIEEVDVRDLYIDEKYSSNKNYSSSGYELKSKFESLEVGFEMADVLEMIGRPDVAHKSYKEGSVESSEYSWFYSFWGDASQFENGRSGISLYFDSNRVLVYAVYKNDKKISLGSMNELSLDRHVIY